MQFNFSICEKIHYGKNKQFLLFFRRFKTNTSNKYKYRKIEWNSSLPENTIQNKYTK